MEGQVSISNVGEFFFLPSLRPEIHCVVAIEIFPSVHVIWYEADACTFTDEDRTRAVWTTTARDEGCLLSYADVYWNGGIQAKSWEGQSTGAVWIAWYPLSFNMHLR